MVYWMVISWNPLGSADEQYAHLVGIHFGTQLCDTKECEPDIIDSDFLYSSLDDTVAELSFGLSVSEAPPSKTSRNRHCTS